MAVNNTPAYDPIAMKEAVLHNLDLPGTVSTLVTLADPHDLIYQIDDWGAIPKEMEQVLQTPTIWSFGIALRDHGGRVRDIYHAQLEDWYYQGMMHYYNELTKDASK